MSTRKPLPHAVETRPDARMANSGSPQARHVLEDIDVETSRAVTPQHEPRIQARLLRDVKLLFAALGAGGSAVPMGDNGPAARRLALYAESLGGH